MESLPPDTETTMRDSRSRVAPSGFGSMRMTTLASEQSVDHSQPCSTVNKARSLPPVLSPMRPFYGIPPPKTLLFHLVRDSIWQLVGEA